MPMGPAGLSFFEISLQVMETFLEGCRFDCGGTCIGVHGQMPLIELANAHWCGGKCLLVWRQMPLCVEAIAFEVLSLLLQGRSLDTQRMTPPLLATLPGVTVSVQALP